MAKKPTDRPEPPVEEVQPRVLEEPGAGASEQVTDADDNNVWMRGLWMVVLALLFGIGEFVLVVAAVLQFLWLLFGKERNEPIAAFGKDLADWLARIALYQAGSTDERPFPFTRWGPKD
ncbi:DUF4389 domain-containing protein [Maritimibacter fusiformis]|uniref:DUF4389 domain-containing protein n=1 Tax=Maritimibacter fusiformis TaxID=2603819 RepID=A0A5D0RQV9_9RHOB|nr:DUF4389 domain-containing protein [Maritimibacter fusiformis]TYB82944.1 DUF4389 domain-containing protein [Maritimibacter fusiformis]